MKPQSFGALVMAGMLCMIVILGFASGKFHPSTPKHTPQTFQIEIGENEVSRIYYRLLVTEYQDFRQHIEQGDQAITHDLQLGAKLRQAVDAHFGQPGGPQSGDRIELCLPGSSMDDPRVYLTYPKMDIVVDDGHH